MSLALLRPSSPFICLHLPPSDRHVVGSLGLADDLSFSYLLMCLRGLLEEGLGWGGGVKNPSAMIIISGDGGIKR